MQITKVILQTSALRQLTGFYADIMGLPVIQKSDEQLVITIGSSQLMFKKAETADPFYHIAINIPANKIEEARAWLRERLDIMWVEDYKSEIADFVSWHARSVYFYDPAGNILELIARFDLKNETDQPFSPLHFLSISEIGLVCKAGDLDNKTAQLLSSYDLAYFDKQPPLPQFKAIGDDEGLFIVVPENRNWFPTSKPSGIFPIEIHFTSGQTPFVLTI